MSIPRTSGVNPDVHGIPKYELNNLGLSEFFKFLWEPWNCGYNEINFKIRVEEQMERAHWKILRFKSQQSFRARLAERPITLEQRAAQVERGTWPRLRAPSMVWTDGSGDEPLPKRREDRTHFDVIAELISQKITGAERPRLLRGLRDDPESIEAYVRMHLFRLCRKAAKETRQALLVSYEHTPTLIVEHLKSFFAREIASLRTPPETALSS